MQSFDFILETLAHFTRQTEGPPPGVPVHTERDFERELTWLCEWHSLTPIVLASLEKLALRPQLSRITLERMKALARASRNLGEGLLATARSLAAACSDRNVDALLLNDVVLTLGVYPARGLRPVERIELLVTEAHWRDVLDICRSVGFRPNRRHPSFEDGRDALIFYQYYSPCVLENEKGDHLQLRFRLFDLGRPDASEAAWDRARGWSGDGARSIGFEDQLIQSLLTYNMTRFGKLLHAVDIGLILGRFGGELDWAYVEDRLRSRSVYRAAFFTLENVVRWLKLRHPPLKLRDPGRLQRRVFDILWDSDRGGHAARPPDRLHRLRFCLLESGRWTEKLHLMARLVSPSPQWVAAFFDRPYKPWLKLRFIILTLRGRIGSRST